MGQIIEETASQWVTKGKQANPEKTSERFYHGITRDWITNEIFRRVEPEGKTMGEYVRNVLKLKGIIIGGPGPSKEEFHNENFLNQDIKKNVITVVDVGYSGEQGIAEVLEKSKDILAKESMLREKKATDRFFNILGKTPDLATYGNDNVKKAAEMGAVELMLISDSKDEDEIEKFADLIEAQRGDWIIISSISREGQTLDGLGGVGAILRYKVNW